VSSLKDDLFQGILSDGQEIAVKKLLGRAGSGLDQLHNEVQVLAELQHKNLVGLQGFCSHQHDTLLVYEYIKNGSLDNILFGTFLFIHLFCCIFTMFCSDVIVNEMLHFSNSFHESYGILCSISMNVVELVKKSV
jgi:serine/threonine protein kinase